MIHATASKPKFLAVLNMFKDDPETRKKAAKNVAAFFKKHGAAIPAGMKVGLRNNGPKWCVDVCAQIGDDRYCLHYAEVSGFGTGPCES